MIFKNLKTGIAFKLVAIAILEFASIANLMCNTNLSVSAGKTGSKRPPKVESLGYTDVDGLKQYKTVYHKDSEGKIIFEIPSGVITIEDHAFHGESINKIVIPNTVNKIGIHAFENCRNLERIDIPPYITEIGQGAFAGCESLQVVEFLEDGDDDEPQLTKIEADTFGSCSSLEKILIPSSVTEIGDRAFFFCKNLVDIEFLNDSELRKIGDSCFEGCTKLGKNEVIYIPKKVESIGKNAFHHCRRMRGIVINTEIKMIGHWAFAECGQDFSDRLSAPIGKPFVNREHLGLNINSIFPLDYDENEMIP